MRQKGIKKVSLSCCAFSHGHMKVKVTFVTLFDADPLLLTPTFLPPTRPYTLSFLKKIFIVNPSPVARFEHVAPYVHLPFKPQISNWSH